MILSEDWPRIIPCRIRGSVMWKVDARPKCRRFFHTEREASDYRELLRREVSEHGLRGQGPDERIDAARAREILAEYRVSLTTAAAYYHEQHKERQAPKMADICADYINSKESENERGEFSNQSIKTARGSIKKIVDAFGDKKPAEIAEDDVIKWLDGMSELSQQTRAHHRKTLARLLRRAVKKGWCKQNPCDEVNVRVIRDLEACILTVEEAVKIVESAERSPFAKSLAPFVYLGLFAGMRPWEVMGLSWDDIQGNQIRVNWNTSKRRETRFIQMEPGLQQKLEKHRASGPIRCENFDAVWLAARMDAGWGPKKPWPRDVLRHSFASYWLAVHKNRAELSEIMGNTPEIIRRHYRKAVPVDAAKAFWAILSG